MKNVRDEQHEPLSHAELERALTAHFRASDKPGEVSFARLIAASMVRDLAALEEEGLTRSMALAVMRGRKQRYPRGATLALETMVGYELREPLVYEVEAHEVRAGLLLAQSVRTRQGRLLVARGIELDAGLCAALRSMSGSEIQGPLRVVVPEDL